MFEKVFKFREEGMGMFNTLRSRNTMFGDATICIHTYKESVSKVVAKEIAYALNRRGITDDYVQYAYSELGYLFVTVKTIDPEMVIKRILSVCVNRGFKSMYAVRAKDGVWRTSSLRDMPNVSLDVWPNGQMIQWWMSDDVPYGNISVPMKINVRPFFMVKSYYAAEERIANNKATVAAAEV